MSRSEVGPAILEAREKLELTQVELGSLLGVSRESVGSWESNEHFPRSKAGKLKDVLGIDIREIRDRVPVDQSVGRPSEGLVVLSLKVAIEHLRAGQDPATAADFLERVLEGLLKPEPTESGEEDRIA